MPELAATQVGNGVQVNKGAGALGAGLRVLDLSVELPNTAVGKTGFEGALDAGELFGHGGLEPLEGGQPATPCARNPGPQRRFGGGAIAGGFADPPQRFLQAPGASGLQRGALQPAHDVDLPAVPVARRPESAPAAAFESERGRHLGPAHLIERCARQRDDVVRIEADRRLGRSVVRAGTVGAGQVHAPVRGLAGRRPTLYEVVGEVPDVPPGRGGLQPAPVEVMELGQVTLALTAGRFIHPDASHVGQSFSWPGARPRGDAAPARCGSRTRRSGARRVPPAVWQTASPRMASNSFEKPEPTASHAPAPESAWYYGNARATRGIQQ